jgi:hypothetical protein
MLLAAGKSHSREEFYSTLDNPLYDPADRLVVHAGDRIAAHGLLLRRDLQFGDIQLPAGDLRQLAIAEEFATRNWLPELIETSEKRMWGDGAVLATTWSDQSDALRQAGWWRCPQQGYSRATARDILSHWIRQTETQPNLRRYCTRTWRRVEIHALVDVFRSASTGRFGSLHRDEAYWQWLVSRRAFDLMIVAIDGPDSHELGDAGPKIAGYAAMSGPHVVELLTAPGAEQAAPSLLAEACREAIERGLPTISLQTPPDDVLHEFLITAGGVWKPRETDRNALWWKVLGASELVRRMSDSLLQRAKAAKIARPLNLRLRVGLRDVVLQLSRRGARLIADQHSGGRRDLQCAFLDFQKLLLGQLNLETARQEGTLMVKNRACRQIFKALFPPCTLSRPLLDDLST